MNRGVQRLSRWALGLALLPLVWAVAREMAGMVPIVGKQGVDAWWRYLAGAAAYILVERLFHRPMWLYVVGHEMTHAVSGLLSGAKIHSFRAKSDGGEVRLSKSNAFIALSPYVVPLYAAVLMGVFSLVQRFGGTPWLTPAFQFLLGGALAFHVSLTLSALHGRQTDLKVLGFFLSGVLIALGNALIFALLGISLFAKTPTIKTFASAVGNETLTVWKMGWNFMHQEVKRLNDQSAPREEFSAWTR